jgi:soluble lytic murein transglycosylase-like protein
MGRGKSDWVYIGLGLTGFLALVSYKPKPTPTPKPPEKGETKSVEYQTDKGKVLVQTVHGADWTAPQLPNEEHAKFRTMVEHWKEFVEEAVLDYRVPESWMWAVMWSESRGDPKAKSKMGAIGLMQVMPYHFKPEDEPFDPRTNIRAGARYMQNGRAKVADLVQLASYYNAGGPWTNETWLAAKRKPSLTTKWGYPAEKGYIDEVVKANNTFLSIGIGQS